ncbi:C4-dicarboxylate ABC transporter substrate-binding protein [Thalassospira profundimaris]|nr:C4-dicarboxylate ABC transporter substrate-binding protein [Thalassospira profundimaris]
MFRKLLIAGVMTSALAVSFNQAQAADYTLRFSHQWPPVAGMQKDLFQVWADTIAKESDGRIEVEMYPSATLAAPPAQYEAVEDGIADVAAAIQGYTANRFPLTQVVELPGLIKNAAHGSCIIQSLYDEGLISDEYKGTRPLFLFTHGQGLLHTGDKLIATPDDLAGLRIRRPTSVVANILEAAGAQPLGMPAPESYQAMQLEVIDGVALPWEGALAFRLNELAKAHTNVGDLYTLSFLVTMNEDSFEDLPEDLQDVITKNSGMAWSEKAGNLFDALDAKGLKQAQDAGHTFLTVEGGVDNPAWKPVLDKATETYLADLESRGLPARKVYARAKELAATCK